MTISAFDHPWLAGLVSDAEANACFSAEADLQAMIAFETALAESEAELGLIPEAAALRIAAALAAFQPDLGALAAGVERDGVIVPALVAQLRAAVGEPHARWLHRGATSQDVIDTSLTLRLSRLVAMFDLRLVALIDALQALEAREGEIPLMGRTRLQRALPIRAADRIGAWRRPIEAARARLAELRPRLCVIQFGGAVGTRGDLEGQGEAVAAGLARRLGLGDSPCWHVERARLAEFAGWMGGLCGALGKLGADAALMAQNEVGELRLRGGGGSSAMPHKSNPVGAEVLVALAHFAAAQASGPLHAMIAEYERSGAAWTLEWLSLPPLAAAAGGALKRAIRLVDAMSFAPVAP